MHAWDPYKEYKRSDQGEKKNKKLNNICISIKRLGTVVQKAMKNCNKILIIDD